MTQTTIGKYIITEEEFIPTAASLLPRYNIIVTKYDGTEIEKHTGCVGSRARDYWRECSMMKISRLNWLWESLEMAKHNINCYDRPGYEEQHKEEVDRAFMLTDWIGELEG